MEASTYVTAAVDNALGTLTVKMSHPHLTVEASEAYVTVTVDNPLGTLTVKMSGLHFTVEVCGLRDSDR